MFEVVIIDTWNVLFVGTEVECRDWVADACHDSRALMIDEDELMIVEATGTEPWVDEVDDRASNPFA